MKHFKIGLTQEELRKEYRKLAKKYHPDVSKDPEAERIFKEINDEYKSYENSFVPIREDIFGDYFTTKYRYSRYSDTTQNTSDGVYYNIYLVKEGSFYKGNCDGMDLFYTPKDGDREIQEEGFVRVVKSKYDFMPNVKLSTKSFCDFPTDEGMYTYFRLNIFPETIEWYNNDYTWLDYINERYELAVLAAPNEDGGKCYIECRFSRIVNLEDDDNDIEYYTGISFLGKDCGVVKNTMSVEYARRLEEKYTMNWFDFPFICRCGCDLNEFVSKYDVENIPHQATEIVTFIWEWEQKHIPDIIKEYTNRALIKVYSVPRHKDIIFGCFSFLNLVHWLEYNSMSEIDAIQTALTELNESSREKLKNLIKKRKIEP